MALINLEAFRAAPLATAPFQHMVVPGFLNMEEAQSVPRNSASISATARPW
jgi:hypothetical protein